MANYNTTDILVSPSGDLSMDQNGDFTTTSASGVLKQDIAFRVRTNYGEHALHPEIGSDLEEIVGEPNSQKNIKYGEVKIIHSLTQDGMIEGSDLFVKGMPVGIDQSVYYVFVRTKNGQVNLTPNVVFSARNGIVNIPDYIDSDSNVVV